MRNIQKKFGDTVAVDDVPIHVKDGELLVLLGPSGCGKSTTLRLIGGLEYPTEGKIVLDGRDITDIAPHKRNIAMVFQDLALYSHKSVRENMAFGLKMRGLSSEDATPRVEKAVELLQISELLDRSPTTLSGDNNSGSQSAARLSASRRCSCSTNRYLTSTPSSVRLCGRKFWNSTRV